MQLPSSEIRIVLTIAGAAAATYAIRLGGLLLSDRMPQSGRFKAFMEALPGTILLALVAPGIFAAGAAGAAAALCTAVCTFKTRNLFLSMLLGMAIVALHRYLTA